MTIQELIDQLQEILDEHGDQELKTGETTCPCCASMDTANIEIDYYDSHGPVINIT